MRLIHASLPVLLAVLGGPSLTADEARLGVQGGMAIPLGDLSDVANLGFQAGVHGRWDLGSGHGLMARVDYAGYGSKQGNSTWDLGGGVDYTYHLNQNRRGPYLLAGMSIQEYNVTNAGSNIYLRGLGFDLGLGYDLDRNLGLQTRLTTHNLNNSTFTSMNVGITYSF